MPLYLFLTFTKHSCSPCCLPFLGLYLFLHRAYNWFWTTSAVISHTHTKKNKKTSLFKLGLSYSPSFYLQTKSHLCRCKYICGANTATGPLLLVFLSILNILIWVPKIISFSDLSSQVNIAHSPKIVSLMIWGLLDYLHMGSPLSLELERAPRHSHWGGLNILVFVMVSLPCKNYL